jgi:hypothetical protein
LSKKTPKPPQVVRRKVVKPFDNYFYSFLQTKFRMALFYKKTPAVYGLFLIVIIAALNMNYTTGSTSDRSGSPANNSRSCKSCHTAPAMGGGGGSVLLSGAPINYVLGQTYPLTLTVMDADMAKAGFMVAAVDMSNAPSAYTYAGSFTAGTGSRLVNTVGITHDDAKTPTSGQVSWTFDWTAPSSGTGSIQFYFAGNAVDGNADSANDDVYLSSTSSTVLPIQLLDFNVKTTETGITLDWSTESETNSRHFEVERKGNTGNFIKIGTVKAQDKSAQKTAYTFTDDAPLVNSEWAYYRLKMVDFDGKLSYSPIKSVQSVSTKQILVYPTLNTEGGSLTIYQPNPQPQTALFYDVLGRLVKTTPLTSGQNSIPLTLPKGQYFVQINGQTKTVWIQ